jgi:single-stranded-DNA-specific exonuclease
VAMLLRKEWRVKPDVPATGTLAARILAGRGLTDPAAAQAFLHPALDRLHDAFLLPDMEAACAAIGEAVDTGRPIMIHGDYDADGITATALLLRFLRRLGADCSCLIPDRMTDGYGLNASGADQIIAAGAQLLVTVDCGIASSAEVERLKAAGIPTVITDHHECPPQLPEAVAVVNPKRPDSAYPFTGLAGVGVALKLVQALCRRRGLGDLWQEDLALVALGTVADVVPLLDENRILVSVGMERLAQGNTAAGDTRQPGLSALLAAIGLAGKPITSQTLGYALAPRLNAAGRLGRATAALALLLAEDPAEAAGIAAELVELNRQRQELEMAITREATEDIERSFDFSSRDLVIVAREGWHQGVIGIVAARLADQYSRPVIVLTGDNGVLRGSCRSVGDFDILAAISYASAFTMKFGGHRKAAGLVVSRDQLADFCRAVNEYARENLPDEPLRPAYQADLEIGAEELTLANADALRLLAPYGENNPQPLLILRGLTLQTVRQAGNGRHLKVQLRNGDRAPVFDGIAFGQSEADEIFAAGDRVDILFSLDINEWQGSRSVSLNIRDLAHSRADDEFRDEPWLADRAYRESADLGSLMRRYDLPLQALRPSREEYKTVYQFIRTRFGEKPVLLDLTLLARCIARSYATDLNMFRLARILHVFEEINLLRVQPLGSDRVRLALLPALAKVRLEDSPAFCAMEGEVLD